MQMKRQFSATVLAAVFTLLVLMYVMLGTTPSVKSGYQILRHRSFYPLRWFILPDATQVLSSNTSNSKGQKPIDLSPERLQWLDTWKQLKELINSSQSSLPHAVDAINEAAVAWGNLTLSVQNSSQQEAKEQQCPYSIRHLNLSEREGSDFKMMIPCGLVAGSSITLIGTPGVLSGNFRIDLIGTALPGEPEPPIVLHYNVRLYGDRNTEEAVIVQNTWTSAGDWGSEEFCPWQKKHNRTKVDDLEQCNFMVAKDEIETSSSTSYTGKRNDDEPRRHFPFKHGYLAIATLRIGSEGFHMTVDGKHITSFRYRARLEPWLVTAARISGDFKTISFIASGLPTSEDLESAVDLEILKSPPIMKDKPMDLFIGVFSTTNNFKRRMAVRRTWMQYDDVRSGKVAVRFFVGLHTNVLVNKELWKEARTYGDIQLMPFIDYYSLITWKTIAICIYGTTTLPAKFLMKTDDDAFVRVDKMLSSLKESNVTRGLLYGRINYDSGPHRNQDSKWYISTEEWPDEKYPLWAHGPGYVVSTDIAQAIYDQHINGSLTMFKLEDVAMGIWISEITKQGLSVEYVSDSEIYTDGCEEGYTVAHYQEPRKLMCLWRMIQETRQAKCCDDA